MHISSFLKHISTESTRFNQKFATIEDEQKKAQICTKKAHLLRQETINNGKNKIRNKWQ